MRGDNMINLYYYNDFFKTTVLVEHNFLDMQAAERFKADYAKKTNIRASCFFIGSENENLTDYQASKLSDIYGAGIDYLGDIALIKRASTFVDYITAMGILTVYNDYAMAKNIIFNCKGE